MFLVQKLLMKLFNEILNMLQNFRWYCIVLCWSNVNLNPSWSTKSNKAFEWRLCSRAHLYSLSKFSISDLGGAPPTNGVWRWYVRLLPPTPFLVRSSDPVLNRQGFVVKVAQTLLLSAAVKSLKQWSSSSNTCPGKSSETGLSLSAWGRRRPTGFLAC